MSLQPTILEYQGSELEVFAAAVNWKRYWSNAIAGYLGETVIEVGAGLGGSTPFLCKDAHKRWLCLDPDPGHVRLLQNKIANGELSPICEAHCGVLSDLAPEAFADTIVYIDVLEHIENDADELRQAIMKLKPGGHIVVLAPAFNFLFSEFDRSVGHYRRYTRQDALRLTVPPLSLSSCFFLDSVGFFAALSNRFFLKKEAPSARDIHLWDRAMVPISRLSDSVLGAWFGKTIIMVWRKA